ncbi:MAG TPA: TraR/DksA C4-type zinc finger protein [Actinomycetota bacterium]|nr:TraR/DksA C4-type zinc finger protein [Actinomycetota bacterium]
MDQAQIDELKARLDEELQSLERQLAEHGVAAEGVEVDVDEGFADSAQATAERSEQLALVEQLQEHHRAVLHALAKIADGTYGKCERCGEDIPFERLEARPTAALCVSCAQAAAS